MSLQKRLFTLFSTTLFLTTMLISVSAQTDPPRPAEANYEAVLHVLVAGGQSGSSLPSSLGGVTRAIRNEFGAADLRLINTYLSRVSSNGNIDYKGVSSSYAPESMPGAPTFLEWRLTGVRNAENAAGQPAYQLQGFRFGARVPVRAGNLQEEKGPAPVAYEGIGLTVDRLSVRENIPTLIGTLTQPRTEGTIFLVLTVRNADK